MDLNREKLIREVMAADFTSYDLALYLDTHPNDMRALALFRNNAQRARMLRENYERLYGPLVAQSPRDSYGWLWATTPWPWEKQ